MSATSLSSPSGPHAHRGARVVQLVEEEDAQLVGDEEAAHVFVRQLHALRPGVVPVHLDGRLLVDLVQHVALGPRHHHRPRLRAQAVIDADAPGGLAEHVQGGRGIAAREAGRAHLGHLELPVVARGAPHHLLEEPGVSISPPLARAGQPVDEQHCGRQRCAVAARPALELLERAGEVPGHPGGIGAHPTAPSTTNASLSKVVSSTARPPVVRPFSVNSPAVWQAMNWQPAPPRWPPPRPAPAGARRN